MSAGAAVRGCSRRHFPRCDKLDYCTSVSAGVVNTGTAVSHQRLSSETQNLRGPFFQPSVSPAAGGGAARPPGAMCLPHANNMDNKLQGAGTGGGASLRPRAGGVSLEPFIHQVGGTRKVCLFVSFKWLFF